MRSGVLGGTIFLYPLGSLLVNGPLLKKVFPYTVRTDYDVPEHLHKLIEEEYQEWLKREGRSAKDGNAKFSIQTEPSTLFACLA